MSGISAKCRLVYGLPGTYLPAPGIGRGLKPPHPEGNR